MAKQEKKPEPEKKDEQKEKPVAPVKPFAFLIIGNDKTVDLTVNTFPLETLRGVLWQVLAQVNKALTPPEAAEGAAEKPKAPAEAPAPPAAE